VFPLCISKLEGDAINISDEDRQHYCLIRSMSRHIGDLTRHANKGFYFNRCLHRFAKEKTLKSHMLLCGEHAPQKTKLPSEENKILRFVNQDFQHILPYIIYADFEALVVKMNSVAQNPSTSFTNRVASILHVFMHIW